MRSVGLASTIEDIENIVIKADHGTPVFLEQVAEVGVGGAVRRGVQTRNGVDEVVAGMVIKLFGTNSSTVIERVEARMEEINHILPGGVRLVPYYEQKTLVAACVDTVTDALVQGIVLVTLVLVLFMGSVRPSLVVALSIPFSVLFATLGMGWFGISANLMSLGGLAIAIGMMVDGTIVVVENRRPRAAPARAGRGAPPGRGPRLRRGRPTDRLRHPHHHRRLPAPLHPPGGGGQDLPAPGVHRFPGDAGFPGLRPLPGAGAVAPAAALTPVRGGRRSRPRGLAHAAPGAGSTGPWSPVSWPTASGPSAWREACCSSARSSFRGWGRSSPRPCRRGPWSCASPWLPPSPSRRARASPCSWSAACCAFPRSPAPVSRIGPRGGRRPHGPDQQRRDVPAAQAPAGVARRGPGGAAGDDPRRVGRDPGGS